MIAGFATGMAIGVTPAVLATPVEFAKPDLDESPDARIQRLGSELSQALDEFWGGRFRGIVEPASRSDGAMLLKRVLRVQS